MTNPSDPRIIAAMYSDNGDEEPSPKVTTPQPATPLTEGSLDSSRNVHMIKLNKQLITVPSVRYVQDISKELNTVKTQAKMLASENRQLKHSMRALANEIRQLKLALDNKIDKL